MFENLRAHFSETKVSVPVTKILWAFDLERKDLNPAAADKFQVIGFDIGAVHTSSDGKEWEGTRRSFVSAVTNDSGERVIKLGAGHILSEDSVVLMVRDHAQLTIATLDEDRATLSHIGRCGKVFNDKARIDEFFASVQEWKNNLHTTPTFLRQR